MIRTWPQWQIALALAGAGLLMLLDLALTVALVAIASLSSAALRRISSESEGRLNFLERMQRPPSSHRAATAILRQWCLLGATLLIVLAVRGAGLNYAVLAGVLLGALLGVLFFEGVVARSLALWNPRRAVRMTAFSVRLAYAALWVLVRPLNALLEPIDRRRAPEDQVDEEEEVEALIEVGEREGLFEATEGEMMRGIVDLDETAIREIMTPRTDIVALPVETTVAQARRSFLEAGHSRLPVYRSSIDNVVGVLHSRDLFRAWEDDSATESVTRYMRSASFVPEDLSAAALLAEMRQRTHLALVVDAYGGIAGLVTLEDLMEEIVGDIRDEHETGEEEETTREPDGAYVISAGTHVETLEELFGVDFEPRDFDTVGGLVVGGFGRVPSPGEILETHGLRVEVLQADRRRVHRVRVRSAGHVGDVRATK